MGRAVFAAFLLAAWAAGSAMAAEPYKPGDRYLSKAQLEAFGPVTLSLPQGGSIRILSVGIAGKPDAECKLLLPAVQRIVARKAEKKGGRGGVVVKIHLKPERAGDGELICANEGDGCVVEVEVKKMDE